MLESLVAEEDTKKLHKQMSHDVKALKHSTSVVEKKEEEKEEEEVSVLWNICKLCDMWLTNTKSEFFCPLSEVGVSFF